MKLHYLFDPTRPLAPLAPLTGEFVKVEATVETRAVFLDGYHGTTDDDGESLQDTMAYLQSVFRGNMARWHR